MNKVADRCGSHVLDVRQVFKCHPWMTAHQSSEFFEPKTFGRVTVFSILDRE